MIQVPVNEWLVPFDGGFALDCVPTAPAGKGKSPKKAGLAAQVRRIAEAQRVLYADDRYSVLLVFQAMDAAGKDSTIRAVFSGVNPAGCRVVSFKQPSAIELDHDFLWRTTRELPSRGRIGVFNRSHYEEVLVVRVHPELLEAQRLPDGLTGSDLFAQRFESIRSYESHLAHNGVVILKFFLNVSRDEQRQRFLSRLRTPRKYWKFSPRDVAEAEYWPDYMAAYEAALNETSRPWAPWYAIPADNKPFMRLQVATIVADAMEGLDLSYPPPDPTREAELKRLRAKLARQARKASASS
jgi:PPK2 family polyphosphate:nucleotide phosphotransferase